MKIVTADNRIHKGQFVYIYITLQYALSFVLNATPRIKYTFLSVCPSVLKYRYYVRAADKKMLLILGLDSKTILVQM